MKCTKCGYENPDNVGFCRNCSEPLGHEEQEVKPSWGFVKAPKWADPVFSADTVSEDDVPADFVSEAATIRRQHEAERRAAAEAAAEKARLAAEAAAAKRAAEERREQERRAADEMRAAERRADEERRAADEFRAEEDRRAAEARRIAERRAAEARAAEMRAEEERLRAEREKDELKFSSARKPAEVPEDDYDYEEDEPEKASGIVPFLSGIFKGKGKKSGKNEKYEYQEEDDFDDFEDEYDLPSRSSGKKKGGFDINKAIKIAVVVALVALLALAAVLIATKAKNCAKTSKLPSVEKNPDADAYYVTIYEKEGRTLIYETADGRRQEATVPGKGYVKFNVPVLSLLPNEPIEGAVYEAKPKVFVKNDDGTEKAIENIESIMLDVPAISVTLDNADTIVSEDGTAVISGRVDPVSKVTVNGDQVVVNADGTFSYTVPFEEEGEHNVEIEAQHPGRQIYHHTVKVNVTAPAQITGLIQLPWEYGDTSYSQRVVFSTTVIELRGKVPAGSTLTAECASTKATITQPTVDSEGNFNMTVNMTVAGDFIVKLTCTDPDGHVEEREAHVQRQPNMAEYATAAHLISGTITEIIQEGDFYLAKLQRADGSIVIIEYHPHYGSATTLEVGKSFSSMYGREPKANANGELESYIWFING